MLRFCTICPLYSMAWKIKFYEQRFNSETTHFASHFISISNRECDSSLYKRKTFQRDHLNASYLLIGVTCGGRSHVGDGAAAPVVR